MNAAEMVEGYIGAGLPVFPCHSIQAGRCTCGRNDCHSPGKHPLLGLAHAKDDPQRDTCRGECGRPGHGLYDATTDADQVARWLARWPWANWAARPPTGIIVVDVDPRNGGASSLASLVAENEPLPETLTARTGGGGLHIWLGYNGPLRGKLCTGVDLKGPNGYVIVPPSNHESGGVYEWANDTPPALAPSWVRRLINPPARIVPKTTTGTDTMGGLVRCLERAQEGERNRLLFWCACRAAEKGMDPAALIASAVSLGLSDREVDATVRSAYRRVA